MQGVQGLLQCTQHPGDLIYLPERWHHGVVNHGNSTFGVALHGALCTMDADINPIFCHVIAANS
jgi:oxalate decarboxylase/phosphoglucose isomerase-like protein (cupin superfamily)